MAGLHACKEKGYWEKPIAFFIIQIGVCRTKCNLLNHFVTLADNPHTMVLSVDNIF